MGSEDPAEPNQESQFVDGQIYYRTELWENPPREWELHHNSPHLLVQFVQVLKVRADRVRDILQELRLHVPEPVQFQNKPGFDAPPVSSGFCSAHARQSHERSNRKSGFRMN